MKTIKRFSMFLLFMALAFAIAACSKTTSTQPYTTAQTTANTMSSSANSTQPTTTSDTGVWHDGQVVYSAKDISRFGSGTPSGVANYDAQNDTAVIWNIDASLDNYGGVQTPALSLDFSKAVYFQMEVVSSFTQYIVKLSVEGESEYYYVLSDDNQTGLISVNVVDAMLSAKYEAKNTQPDPGYRTGWIYDNQVKRCSFHILAKGPDGEQQTAELVLKSIAVYNNQPAVESLDISSPAISNHEIQALKGSASVELQATVNPTSEISQDVLWESSDPSIATVDQQGNVQFVGVGMADIRARSEIDQSKFASVTVNVLSGYEDKDQLVAKLETLTYDGSTADISVFTDLFNTTWSEDMTQSYTIDQQNALAYLDLGHQLLIENFFDPTNSTHVAQANQNSVDNIAYQSLNLSGSGDATIYQMIDGALYEVNNTQTLKLAYANYAGDWTNKDTYTVQAIIVWNDGTVKKLNIEVLAATLLEDFLPQDFVDSSQWTVPDRSKLSLDPVINALSPALLTEVSGGVSIKQNKYDESKYCFGGIVSELITVDTLNPVVLQLDVSSLNQMNDYVKTMWDLRIIYYQDDGKTVVNSNPLKIDTGYTTGVNSVTFTPAYTHFRIYLVTNGSDIGAQFADATMVVGELKIYQKK